MGLTPARQEREHIQLSATGNEPHHVKNIDVVMLAVTGGLERTEAQDASLFEAAGLRLERVLQTKASISILEGCAASP